MNHPLAQHQHENDWSDVAAAQSGGVSSHEQYQHHRSSGLGPQHAPRDSFYGRGGPQQIHHLQHSNSMPYRSSSAYSTSVVNGPKRNCERVVYEAVAKACEIAVQSRCTHLQTRNPGRSGGPRGMSDGQLGLLSVTSRGQAAYGAPAQTGTANSGRFQIEVDELPEIRSIINSWNAESPTYNSVHVPLRLDIYYEEPALGDAPGGPSGSAQQQTQPQRELLEKWCIDYIPSNHSVAGSPFSSPSSSRVMTGAVVGSASDVNSNQVISPLRQVCKRIVVLLRSLHCLTRILPAYRLKCLLQSNIEREAAALNVAMRHNRQFSQIADSWGRIGYHVCTDTTYEQALPSPSFCLQKFPSVSTPYGQLCLSVMYDATLNPNYLMEDLLNRRTRWMDNEMRQAASPLQHNPHPAPVESQPIPIDQRNALPDFPETMQETKRPAAARQFSSLPSMALRGPASLGGATGRSRAVSDFIIADYHSPKIKPKSPALTPQTTSPATRLNEGKRVMSGLSLAIMNDETKVSSQENSPRNPTPTCDVGMVPFGSPVTRAAFHSPPPLQYSEEQKVQQQARSTGASYGLFQAGGYGYGYNGSQLTFNGPSPVQQESAGISTPPPPLGCRTLLRGNSLTTNMGMLSLQPTMSSGAKTPPPTLYATMNRPENSPLQQRASTEGGRASRSSQTQRHSSSTALLPPVTSLDILRQSPFSTVRKKQTTVLIEDGQDGGVPLLDSSSIPKSVRGSSTTNELVISSLETSGSAGKNSAASTLQEGVTAHASSSIPLDASQAPPSPSRIGNQSLWANSTVKTETMTGITSTLAVSSLHQRCEERPRLKMFDSKAYDGGESRTADDIQSQLSQFRDFGASLMGNDSNDPK